MKVSKAIEILTQDLKDPGSADYVGREEAQELSIEALKREQKHRQNLRLTCPDLFPGETPEDE